MNKEIIAKDSSGIKRCYGIGENHQQAMSECLTICHEYLERRKDIESLFLFYGETDKPVIDAARYENWEVKR